MRTSKKLGPPNLTISQAILLLVNSLLEYRSLTVTHFARNCKLWYNGLMGTPTPPPPVIGDLCGLCDGVLWPVGETPSFVKVTFADLVKCPLCPIDPPNGVWWLAQDPVKPCYWYYTDAIYKIWTYHWGAGAVLKSTTPDDPATWQFFHGIRVPCLFNFTNTHIACAGIVAALGGTGVIDWPGV